MTNETKMTGAQALVKTLAQQGVDTCFANPGTSEMHLVTALDREPAIKSVLGLYEGVVTGAADGYGRIAGKPAMTLLHLGSGYLNGGANIHNARRAFSPMINVIGDHATYHVQYDAPLTSDIHGMAAPNSTWIDTIQTAEEAGEKTAQAWAACQTSPTGPVSLILPADTAWNEGGSIAPLRKRPEPQTVEDQSITKVITALREAKNPTLLINGSALEAEGLKTCSRLNAAGIRVLYDFNFGTIARGAGHFAPDRMQYFSEMAEKDMENIDLLVLVGTKSPAAFFAYPGKPSDLTPKGAEVLSLGGAEIDSASALSRLADEMGINDIAPVEERVHFDSPQGHANPHTVGQSIARHLPENAFISDDAVTSGGGAWAQTMGANPHHWMPLSGGALGQGMPVALGAAIADRSRKGLCLLGDGAAMYSNQALWSMARESVDVVNVVFVNNSYRILNIELERTGAGNPGATSKSLLTLGQPEIDWVAMAKSMGVPGTLVSTAEDFDHALARGFAEDGPSLIAVQIA